MATLTERFKALEEQETKADKQEKTTPSNVIYPQRSGTKDVKVNFTIGGNFKSIKKVSRNPTPIYGSSTDATQLSGSLGEMRQEVDAGGGVVNIKRATKLLNIDDKPVMALGVKKVYGMVLMGGAGVEYAAGKIRKLEPLKVLRSAD